MSAIFTDCDGVLVSAWKVEHRFHERFLAWWGFDFQPEEIFANFIGYSAADVFKILEQDFQGREGMPLNRDFFHLAVAAHQIVSENHAVPIEGISGVFKTLADRQKLAAVISNGSTQQLYPKIEKVGLTDSFAGIYAGDMVDRLKPAPDVILHAAHDLGVEIHKCTVVEDSIPGIQAARAAGCYVIALTVDRPEEMKMEGNLKDAGANEIVHSVEELEGFLLGS